MLERLIDALVASRTKPVIDKVFTFDQAIDAYRYLEAAHHFGKVVIRV